jgi:hypothetical protein
MEFYRKIKIPDEVIEGLGEPARYLRQYGLLRPVVERVLKEFLKCGPYPKERYSSMM